MARTDQWSDPANYKDLLTDSLLWVVVSYRRIPAQRVPKQALWMEIYTWFRRQDAGGRRTFEIMLQTVDGNDDTGISIV